MFILYAVAGGIIAGYILGGRLERLGRSRIRWAWLAVAGLLVQVVLFSPIGGRLAGDLGPAVYVGSTLAVLAVVLANLGIPGLTLVAIGSASNLAAILANGGYMPADPDALASLGESVEDGYSNSAVVADPALRPLTDIFAMPAWLPFANVFSIGDVLIGLGIAIAIATAMRSPAPGGGADRAPTA
jgi:hypothetical protein